MSNELAIAAVTAALRTLLEIGIKGRDDSINDEQWNDLIVTTLPPDRARKDKEKNQVNIFLYQTLPNAAFRNMDMPRQVRSGESSLPPLALNLNYLITAYGKENDIDDTLTHRLLGKAMRILYDHPVLVASDLLTQIDIQNLLSDSGLGLQPEHVRFTPISMSLEEMSKLWMIFQTQYRISAAYQAAVLLIESTRPVRSRPPVLKRGEGDRGTDVMAAASPILEEVLPPNSQPSARLGEELIIKGKNLDSQKLVVRFSSLRMEKHIDIEPEPGGSATQMRVILPEDGEAKKTWMAGFYTLSLVVKRQNMPGWCSNEIAFSLAPKITVKPNEAKEGNEITLTVNCTPSIKKGQRIVLLFGESQISPPEKFEPTEIKFIVKKDTVTIGEHVVRLRIDGSDSLPIIIKGTPPRMEYDDLQKVKVTGNE